MLRTALSFALALAFAVPAYTALACGEKDQAKAWKKITVEELATLQEKGEPVTILDANSESTRKKHGVIPGAVMLTSYAEYDIAGELPESKDATLVFYCGSQRCSAAPKAADRAAAAGYKNVFVLRAGIKGWAEAGKPTAAVNS